MSAGLIRNLIASKLGCNPCDVILSGEINPSYVAVTKIHTTFDCLWECKTTLYAMYKDSFDKVSQVDDDYQTDGHTSSHTKGIPLFEVAKAQEAIFFVEVSKEAMNGWNEEVRVYKPADFAGKLAKVTVDDIQRWENWLNHE